MCVCGGGGASDLSLHCLSLSHKRTLGLNGQNKLWQNKQQNLGRRFGTSKMHLSPPVA